MRSVGTPGPQRDVSTHDDLASAGRIHTQFKPTAGFPFNLGIAKPNESDSLTSVPSQNTAFQVRGLEKSYGIVSALRGVDMDAIPDECLVLFGPNGAGKTTLLRILAGLTRPDAGTVTVNGHDIAREGELARQSTGALLHSPMLFADMTVRENLRFFARMFGIPDSERRIGEAAERTHMTYRLDDRVRTLSHGLAKRVALARALLHAPRLLILDEPETGLDHSALKLLDGVIADYRRGGRSVVMTTHSLERGLAWADRVVLLSRGRVLLDRSRAQVSTHDLESAFGGHEGQFPVPTGVA
ncbi:MAG: heme ABC exporter ATP-binding protein CcmA [Dehalococcoidia bacterium]|nr:heme ABC exporter ATP-binding protein CcmA [Dehalococcoidia bacterium]